MEGNSEVGDMGEYYESWLMELIEQCKKDNRTLKRVLFFSLAVDAILAVVLIFR